MDAGVGFGQVRGVKERLKDLKTPKGMYFVTEKSTGPFTGKFGDFLGGHWLKVNYPNAFDARRGLTQGIISRPEAAAIEDAFWKRQLTLQSTQLGGEIGLHGWIEDWDAGPGAALMSWGCIVLQPSEVPALYQAVDVGTMVVIF